MKYVCVYTTFGLHNIWIRQAYCSHFKMSVNWHIQYNTIDLNRCFLLCIMMELLPLTTASVMIYKDWKSKTWYEINSSCNNVALTDSLQKIRMVKSMEGNITTARHWMTLTNQIQSVAMWKLRQLLSLTLMTLPQDHDNPPHHGQQQTWPGNFPCNLSIQGFGIIIFVCDLDLILGHGHCH